VETGISKYFFQTYNLVFEALKEDIWNYRQKSLKKLAFYLYQQAKI